MVEEDLEALAVQVAQAGPVVLVVLAVRVVLEDPVGQAAKAATPASRPTLMFLRSPKFPAIRVNPLLPLP